MTTPSTTGNVFPVTVRTGSSEKIVQLTVGQRAAVILEIIAAELACAITALELFRDGHPGCLSGDDIVDDNYPHRHRHHVHWSESVAVTLYYQSASKSHNFKRNTTVAELLQWAITAFTIDPSIATEIELVRHGQEDELPSTEHLGHLIGRETCASFDVVRGVIANGACQ